MKKIKWLVPTIYIIFLMLPIYWLLNMSFKTTTEIINVYSLWPKDFTLENYVTIFTDSTWYMGYVNSITYTVFNTLISVSAALPAAYAFSRYKFLGDKHLFFWLLTNRMAPPAVFALPFFQFYSSVNVCRWLLFWKVFLQVLYSKNSSRNRYYYVFLFYVFLGWIAFSKDSYCNYC